MQTQNVLFEKNYLDIIFDNRNKEYGAYQLRLGYERNVATALFLTMLLLVVVPMGIKGYGFLFPGYKLLTTKGIHCIQEVPLITPDLPVEKPRPAPPRGNLPPNDVQAPMVVSNNAQDEARLDTAHTELLAMNTSSNSPGGPIGVPTGELGGTGLITDAPAAHADPPPPVIRDWAEKMPEFPGGEEALLSFIRDHVRFPAMERESDINGNVIVSFVVDETGTVINATPIRATTKAFGRASVDVISMLPKFKPGEQAGKPVKVRMTMPIRFQTQ